VIRSWQLQEAKNKFSRVVENAVNDGPQIITKRGVEVAIIISYT
jgi:antitoxin Phd